MAKINSKANDPHEEKKEEVLGAALPLEGDSKVVVETKTITEEKKSDKTEEASKDSEDIFHEVKEEIDYRTYEIPKLLAELEKSCKAENWNCKTEHVHPKSK